MMRIYALELNKEIMEVVLPKHAATQEERNFFAHQRSHISCSIKQMNSIYIFVPISFTSEVHYYNRMVNDRIEWVHTLAAEASIHEIHIAINSIVS